MKPARPLSGHSQAIIEKRYLLPRVIKFCENLLDVAFWSARGIYYVNNDFTKNNNFKIKDFNPIKKSRILIAVQRIAGDLLFFYEREN